MIKLENDFLCVEIAEAGAEVTRIFDKQKSAEILWEGDPLYWKRHSPILFPNVGKTYQNQILIDGTVYPTSQHGFARDQVFTCVESSADEALLMLEASKETKKVYPYEFKLYIHYRLQEKELKVEWRVENCDERTMYFTIGGHPAFRFSRRGEKKEDYVLKFPGKETLTYSLLDPATGTGRPETQYVLKLTDEIFPLTEEMFAKDALIFDDSQIEEAWICHKDGTPYVGIRGEGFANFGIWSVKDAPFVCLEPWAGRCDDYGFAEDISRKKGIISLRAKDIFVKSYNIIVE